MVRDVEEDMGESVPNLPNAGPVANVTQNP